MPRWSRCAIAPPLLIGDPKRRPGDEMALEVEGIVDGSMNAQKALRRRR